MNIIPGLVHIGQEMPFLNVSKINVEPSVYRKAIRYLCVEYSKHILSSNKIEGKHAAFLYPEFIGDRPSPVVLIIHDLILHLLAASVGLYLSNRFLRGNPRIIRRIDANGLIRNGLIRDAWILMCVITFAAQTVETLIKK